MFIAKHKKKIRFLCWVLFWLYIFALVYFLFFAEMLGRTEVSRDYHYNLVLFREIRRFWVYRSQLGFLATVLNLAGNILIFVPFGFLVPTIVRKLRGFFRVVLLGFELSLIVECVQLVTKTGCYDVDDMFLNTVGTMIGFLIYAIAQHRRDVRADWYRASLRKDSSDSSRPKQINPERDIN